tara:strand:- start:2763 stop:3038 length:276 start_codon:yes stop_codon:yes gene_type:complete
MKILLLFSAIFAITHSYCIRGYSVVWRNSDNNVVKQVVFSKNTRFKPYFPNEKEELEKLEYGFVYNAESVNLLQKVLIKKTRVLGDPTLNS